MVAICDAQASGKTGRKHQTDLQTFPLEDLKNSEAFGRTESEEGSVRPWPCLESHQAGTCLHSRDLLLKGPVSGSPHGGLLPWVRPQELLQLCSPGPHGQDKDQKESHLQAELRTRRFSPFRPGGGRPPFHLGEDLAP